MADTKISDLTAVVTPALTDALPVVQGGVTKKETLTQVRTIMVPIVLTADVSGTLPVANGGTGITALGTGVATWWATPSSANLLAAMTDETGTGALVFANTPTLVTPVIGAATGTSAALSSFWSTGATPATTGAGRMSNNTAIYWRNAANSANVRGLYFDGSDGLWLGESGNASTVYIGDIHEFRASGGTTRFTINSAGLIIRDSNNDFNYTIVPGNLAADYSLTLPVLTGNETFAVLALAQTLTNKTINGASNTLTVRLASDVSGTLPVANGGTGITALGTGVATWWATPSSANLLAAMTDETGTGALVFATTPTLVTPVLGAATGTSVALTSFLSAGAATVAASGAVRLGNAAASSIKAHDGAAGLVNIASVDATPNLIIGADDGHGLGQINNTYIYSANTTYLAIGAAAEMAVSGTGLQIGGGAADHGGGDGVIGLDNAAANPTTNPTAGGILFSTAGALHWRGSTGTDTAVAPAEPHCPKCGTDVGIRGATNELFGEELLICARCEKRTGDGVVVDIANFFERRRVA